VRSSAASNCAPKSVSCWRPSRLARLRANAHDFRGSCVLEVMRLFLRIEREDAIGQGFFRATRKVRILPQPEHLAAASR